jgi:hypothetical protein
MNTAKAKMNLTGFIVADLVDYEEITKTGNVKGYQMKAF